METEKSLSGEEAEKDFGGRLFFLAAIFPFSNEKVRLGMMPKRTFSTGWRIPPPREDCAHLMDPGEVYDGPPRRTHSIRGLMQRRK